MYGMFEHTWWSRAVRTRQPWRSMHDTIVRSGGQLPGRSGRSCVAGNVLCVHEDNTGFAIDAANATAWLSQMPTSRTVGESSRDLLQLVPLALAAVSTATLGCVLHAWCSPKLIESVYASPRPSEDTMARYGRPPRTPAGVGRERVFRVLRGTRVPLVRQNVQENRDLRPLQVFKSADSVGKV